MKSTAHNLAPVPSVSLDLFERYKLNDLAQSVARVTPTNPNGRALRKTFKSVWKGLSGNFEVEKKDPDDPDSLWSMMREPNEEWDVKCKGSEIGSGLPSSTLASMSKSFSMARGPIPRELWNPNVLALGDATPPVAIKAGKGASSTAKPLQPPVVGATLSTKDALRPKRNVKKRAYGDSSFEGYGEGYVDDDMQDTGHSDTGDGEDRAGGRKRPKKVRELGYVGRSC